VLRRKQPTRSSPRLSKYTSQTSKGGISGSKQPTIAGPSKRRSVIRETPFSEAAEETAHADDEAADLGADDSNGRADESVGPDFPNLISTYHDVEMEKNKENNKPKGRSIESQTDARKVSGILSDEEEEEEVLPDQRSKSHSKRSHQAANVEEEDDNMFVSTRSRKKGRTQPASSSQPRANSESRRNARGNGPAGEDDDIEEEENVAPVPSQGYREVNDKAKKQVAMNKAVKNQSRVPWTVAECEALVELIGDYGNGYAAISKSEEAREAIQERHREQVALKDKARNIKMDYLLYVSPSPHFLIVTWKW